MVCGTADGARTLLGKLSRVLDADEKEPIGYSATFADATLALAAEATRDRLLHRAAEGLREPAASVRAALETRQKAARAAAILAMIGPKALAVTTNCAIDFMRKPAAGVDLIAKAEVLKLGRALAVTDVRLYSEGQTDPVARASLTYSIPPER